MSATIEDVAKKAGVSTATVSRALRGLPNVSPSTRTRVIVIAEELDYVISPQVSRMVSGRKTIGIVAPLVDQWFYAKLASVAEIVLLTAGYDVVRYDVYSLQIQSQLLRDLLTRKQVDGFIISTLTLSNENIEILERSKIPVVTVETETERFPSVAIDNVAAAELATRHLFNLGHRRIGLIMGLDDDPLKFTIPAARHKGYRQALYESNIEPRPEYEVSGNYSYEGGAEAMKHLFSIPQPPTAVFAISDEMAIGALKTIRDMNLRVPEDVSIIGFDDNDVSEYVGLTTIRQPITEFGEIAANQLISQLTHSDHQENAKIECPVELILRTTTGPCPR